ncbi:MAG: exodeoxyribonuclease VII small subunit [Nitritalea sp.]
MSELNKDTAADKPSFSYDQALLRIEAIVKNIESGQLSMEKLTEEVKEATELIAACKEKLGGIDAGLKGILGE